MNCRRLMGSPNRGTGIRPQNVSRPLQVVRGQFTLRATPHVAAPGAEEGVASGRAADRRVSGRRARPRAPAHAPSRSPIAEPRPQFACRQYQPVPCVRSIATGPMTACPPSFT